MKKKSSALQVADDDILRRRYLTKIQKHVHDT